MLLGTKYCVLGTQYSCYQDPNGVIRALERGIGDPSDATRNQRRVLRFNRRCNKTQMASQGTKIMLLGTQVVFSGTKIHIMGAQ